MKILPDRVYNILKWLALIALDACGALYLTLATIWGLPYGKEVNETFHAIATFIGLLIGVSTIAYHMKAKGEK
jgi:hypothetical protein